MFKNRWMNVLSGFVGAAVILAGTAGIAFAQGSRPPEAGQQLYQDQDGDCVACEMSGWQGTGAAGSARMGSWWGGAQGESLVDALAEVTGLSLDEVIAELDAGKTYAEIAEAQGISVDAVVEEYLSERVAALEEAVADGRFSQEQADLMLAEMTEHVTEHLAESWTAGSDVAGNEYGQGTGLRSEDGSGYGVQGSGRGRLGSMRTNTAERLGTCR
jgi:hypothetical protein